MQKSIFIAAIIILSFTNANAQKAKLGNKKANVSTQSETSNVGIFSEFKEEKTDGFKISLVKPMLTVKMSGTATLVSTGETADISGSGTIDGYGLSVGYENLPVESLGFVGLASFLTFEGKDGASDVKVTRFDGNAAYAISKKLHFKGGLNFATITSSTGESNVDGSFGYQIGIGVKVNQYVGFDFTYGQMAFKEKSEDEDPTLGLIESKSDITFRGFELGLTGTF